MTVKNVSEEKEKKNSSKVYLDFLVPIKLTATTEGKKSRMGETPKEPTEQVKK